MTHWLIFVAAATIAICIVFSGAAAQETQPDATSRPVRAWPILDAPTLEFSFELPLPVGTRDLDRYAEILELSPEQRLYLDRHHAEYLQRLSNLESKHGPALIEAGRATTPGQIGPDSLGAYARCDMLLRRFNELIVQEDERLWVALEPILSEQQLLQLPRVRLHRARARCVPPLWLGFAVAKLDLSRLVEQMPWPQSIRQSLDPLMWEYEQAYTPALLKADQMFEEESFRERALRYSMRFDDAGVALKRDDPATKERIQACREAIARSNAQHGQLQERIAVVNEAYLPKFVAALPPPEARQFERTFLSQAYQRVYPDPDDIEFLFEDVMADQRISDDQRALVDAYWTSYRSEYEKICSDMVAESRRWHEQLARTGGASAAPAHNQLMDQLADNRVAASERFIAIVTASLPAGVLTDKQSMIDQWRRGAANNRHNRAQRGNSPDVR